MNSRFSSGLLRTGPLDLWVWLQKYRILYSYNVTFCIILSYLVHRKTCSVSFCPQKLLSRIKNDARQQAAKQENRRLGITCTWQKQQSEQDANWEQQATNARKVHARQPYRRHLGTCAIYTNAHAQATKPTLPTTPWGGSFVQFCSIPAFHMRVSVASWRISCINNEQHHSQHLACGETFLTCGLCSGLEQTTSNKWRPGVPTTRCCPSRSLSLSSWMDVPGLCHTVTMNVPSNVVGGFGTSCCVISLPCANVAITFPNSPNLCFLLQTPAMAKHAHVLHHLHVRSVVHTKHCKTSL